MAPVTTNSGAAPKLMMAEGNRKIDIVFLEQVNDGFYEKPQSISQK